MSRYKSHILFFCLLFLNLFAAYYALTSADVQDYPWRTTVIMYALGSVLVFLGVLQNGRQRMVNHLFTLMVAIDAFAISVVYLMTTQGTSAGQAIQRVWPLFIIPPTILDAYLQRRLTARPAQSPRIYALSLILDKEARLYWFIPPIAVWVFAYMPSWHWEIWMWNGLWTGIGFIAVVLYLGQWSVPHVGIRSWAFFSISLDETKNRSPLSLTLLKWSVVDTITILYVYTLCHNTGLLALLPPEVQDFKFWFWFWALYSAWLLVYRSWDNPNATVWTRQPE